MPLKLSRRPGQRLFIGETVTVTVLEVRGRQVKLMIEAPDDVPIYREELAARIAVEGCIDKRMEH